MVNSTYLLGYKKGSVGMRVLSQEMSEHMAFGSVYRKKGLEERAPCYRADVGSPAPRLAGTHLLVNWGSQIEHSQQIRYNRGLLILNGSGVKTVSDKLKFFQDYYGGTGIRMPEYTVSHEIAQGWLNSAPPSDRPCVVGRSVLNGHSGAGIVYYRPGDNIDGYHLEDGSAIPRLFTRYIPKKREFRVHFFKNGVSPFIFQEKKKREGTPNGPGVYLTRNADNGWVYCRQDVVAPQCVLAQAEAIKQITPLNFGAIDIIYNEQQDKAYVLEVNTAPGIEGQTIKDYTKAFKQFVLRHDWENTTNNTFHARS